MRNIYKTPPENAVLFSSKYTPTKGGSFLYFFAKEIIQRRDDKDDHFS